MSHREYIFSFWHQTDLSNERYTNRERKKKMHIHRYKGEILKNSLLRCISLRLTANDAPYIIQSDSKCSRTPSVSALDSTDSQISFYDHYSPLNYYSYIFTCTQSASLSLSLLLFHLFFRMKVKFFHAY